jgi:hypothetical protein
MGILGKLSKCHSSLKEIRKYIQHDVVRVNELDLIPLFEAALIVSLKPEFQRQ